MFRVMVDQKISIPEDSDFVSTVLVHAMHEYVHAGCMRLLIIVAHFRFHVEKLRSTGLGLVIILIMMKYVVYWRIQVGYNVHVLHYKKHGSSMTLSPFLAQTHSHFSY